MAKTTKEPKAKGICLYCGKNYVETNYYTSNSKFYSGLGSDSYVGLGRIPYCKQCIEKLYQYYFDRYMKQGYANPERKAVKRLCMFLDVYYKEDVFNSSLRKFNEDSRVVSPMAKYMQTIQLWQYNRNGESYENTIAEEEQNDVDSGVLISASDDFELDDNTISFFGNGFTEDDYKFLKREYDDWVARHECKTKAQEEVFKRLCFKQLEILKATRRGDDTKDLDATFQKLLETAKLQPKQNVGDAAADNQTFGTLIDKWENERPLPEIDEELKDVDKIGFYIDVFFKGHLSKMMGLKNAMSNLYSKFMKKYTVKKPEYNDEENSEILFDAIFGSQTSNSDNE
jgi:hypothetical protein